MVSGQLTCIYIVPFWYTVHSKHFYNTLQHKCTRSHTEAHTDGRGCYARSQLLIRSDTAFLSKALAHVYTLTSLGAIRDSAGHFD